MYPPIKMEPNSLANLCKKVISNNINLQKTNNLPKEGLRERTLLLTVNELKEKTEKEYVNRLKEKKQEIKEFFRKHYSDQNDDDDDFWQQSYNRDKIKNFNWTFFIIFLEREFTDKNFLKKANYDIAQAVVLFEHELNQFTLDYIPCDIKWDNDWERDSDDSDWSVF